mmetsp:Transcript_51861/g.122842  ORF Transcript_51861/g.122842 Transcript_51861/m.122842 type:complete len:222 (-) Transcript_51861:2325-2990(-)
MFDEVQGPRLGGVDLRSRRQIAWTIPTDMSPRCSRGRSRFSSGSTPKDPQRLWRGTRRFRSRPGAGGLSPRGVTGRPWIRALWVGRGGACTYRRYARARWRTTSAGTARKPGCSSRGLLTAQRGRSARRIARPPPQPSSPSASGRWRSRRRSRRATAGPRRRGCTTLRWRKSRCSKPGCVPKRYSPQSIPAAPRPTLSGRIVSPSLRRAIQTSRARRLGKL